ncbi:MAG: hypothetical protein AAGF73_11355 [Actinomycetota bacterium]
MSIARVVGLIGVFVFLTLALAAFFAPVTASIDGSTVHCGYGIIPSRTSAGDNDACDAVRRWRVGAAATLFVLGIGLSYAITHLTSGGSASGEQESSETQ